MRQNDSFLTGKTIFPAKTGPGQPRNLFSRTKTTPDSQEIYFPGQKQSRTAEKLIFLGKNNPGQPRNLFSWAKTTPKNRENHFIQELNDFGLE
jgi:hypothetical protein